MNVIRLAEDRIQQLALRLSARRDALARLQIQRPEILLDLAEVGDQASREVGNLKIALLHLRSVERRGASGAHALDLAVDFFTPTFKLLHSCGRVKIGRASCRE